MVMAPLMPRWTAHPSPSGDLVVRRHDNSPLGSFLPTWIFSLVLLVASTGYSNAQLLTQYFPLGVPGYGDQPGVTVLSRLRPEYQSKGFRTGGIVIRPTLAESFGLDSNVTGTPQAHGSELFRTQATLSAQSDWTRDAVGVIARVDDQRYPQQSGQSLTNWTIFSGAKYDIGRDQVTFGLAHLSLNQTPRDLAVPQLEQPDPYTVNDVRIAYTANFNRLSVQPMIDFSAWRFDNIAQGDQRFILDYQSRNSTSVGLTTRYSLSPQSSLVLVVRGVDNRYVSPISNEPSRDSTGGAVLAGLDFKGSGAWQYQLLLGYEYRSFSSTRYQTISAPIVEGSAIWTPTGRTTVTGSFVHEIQDGSQTNVISYSLTSAKLTVDHEYRRNVLFSGSVQIQRADYQQTGSTQTLYNAGVGVTYLLNRNMRATLGYRHWNRESGSSSYAEDETLLQLRFDL